jgi:hypothetical protein
VRAQRHTPGMRDFQLSVICHHDLLFGPIDRLFFVPYV